MGSKHPATDGIMALVQQGNIQAANGKDTRSNNRDLVQALRDSGIPEGAAVANLIDRSKAR